jgi:hypothetical protein
MCIVVDRLGCERLKLLRWTNFTFILPNKVCKFEIIFCRTASSFEISHWNFVVSTASWVTILQSHCQICLRIRITSKAVQFISLLCNCVPFRVQGTENY